MRDAEARLQSFQNVPSNNGTRVEIDEIVALVMFGFYKTENNGHFVVRCSFCKKASQYRLYDADAAARLNRLRTSHALTSHTCAMSLNHLGDDKPFDEARIRCLRSSALHSTPSVRNNGTTLSSISHTYTTSRGGLSSLIDLSGATNALESIKSVSVTAHSSNTQPRANSNRTWSSIVRIDVSEWAIPSVYQQHCSLIDALWSSQITEHNTQELSSQHTFSE